MDFNLLGFIASWTNRFFSFYFVSFGNIVGEGEEGSEEDISCLFSLVIERDIVLLELFFITFTLYTKKT